MVTAILDTNVFIRAALRPKSPSARVVDAYLDGTFQLVLSQAVLQELLTVLLLPEIREVHGWYRRTRIVTPTQFLDCLS
jgi:predicted nucleic acid-binding protein